MKNKLGLGKETFIERLWQKGERMLCLCYVYVDVTHTCMHIHRCSDQVISVPRVRRTVLFCRSRDQADKNHVWVQGECGVITGCSQGQAVSPKGTRGVGREGPRDLGKERS
jgi:hypothetical protein